MKLRQKQFDSQKFKNNAGGTDYVPPAFCTPPAYITACVPAHVECTGRTVTNGMGRMECATPPAGNSPVLKREAWNES